MTPLSLRVTNFRSVRGTQTFSFPQRPGLYFMQGVNEAEPRLEANGAGKSTLWDALTWCWFGKTSRGLKAGDVCNWDAGKGTEVEFDFVTDSDRCVWSMRRTWSPNTWTLSHEAEYVTDEQVIDLAKEKDNPALSWLGLDFDQWLNCVLMAQGQPMFLDMKREAQASLFSAVVGADSWLGYSARASRLAADRDRKVRDLERELSRLKGELGATERQDHADQSEGFEKNRRARLAGIEDQHDDLMARRERLKNELEGAQEREKNARAWVAQSQPDAALEKDYRRAEANVVDCENLRKERLREAERLKLEAGRYDASAGGECPACGAPMSDGHRAKEYRRLMRLADNCLAEAQRFAREGKASQEQVDRLREQYEKQVQDRDAARAELDEAQRGHSNARRALEQCDRDLDDLEDKHARLKAERNPYADMEERRKREVDRLVLEVADAQERMDAAAARQALFQFWVRGFKDVRLAKIDEALSELEVEANSAVDALGLLGWELQFQVDRETKGGKIERGFNVLVRSPSNDRQVPWEAWSGGESQRLRVAGTMGLSDLVRSRTGCDFPLEVWDEPTQGLSPQGIRDLLECLEERARREQRVIYLVDHRSHDFGGFAGGCVVRKTDKGTVIEGV